MICQAQERLKPRKAEPSISLNERPEPFGNARIKRAELMPARDVNLQIMRVQSELNGFAVLDHGGEGTTPAMVRGHQMEDQILVRRFGEESGFLLKQ
jgi:hypothetical protein